MASAVRPQSIDLAGLTPSRVQLAALFGTSVRWVGALRGAGSLPPDGATLAENVAAWVTYKAARDG